MVSLYLQIRPKVYSLFGIKDDEKDLMLWVNVMNLLRKGMLGLVNYDPDTKEWNDPDA